MSYYLKLSESRIFNYKKTNFEVQLKIATKGKGISVIINCLSGSDFHATMRIIAPYGKFFQLTKTDMKNKGKFGRSHCCCLLLFKCKKT